MHDNSKLIPGLTQVRTCVVTDAMTADAAGNSGFQLLSAAALIQECELACIELVQPLVGPGKGTVGIRIDFNHVAPTPVGVRVSTTAVLNHVEGNKLGFAVEAHDERSKIAEGTHERVVVEIARFMARA